MMDVHIQVAATISCIKRKDNNPGESIPMKKDDSTLLSKFVWPWVGLIANIPREVGPNRTPTGKSRATLRQDLIHRGFKPTKVELLWDHNGHSGFGFVEFGKHVDGFEKAMEFDRKFSLDGHGKREWMNGTLRDENLYGWVAREEDFNVSGVVRRKLRTKAYDLKSVKQISEEEERKLNQLVASLSQSVDREAYYEEGIEKIRSDEAKYRTILKGDACSEKVESGGDAALEKTAKPREIVGSSGEQFSEDDDEDAPNEED